MFSGVARPFTITTKNYPQEKKEVADDKKRNSVPGTSGTHQVATSNKGNRHKKTRRGTDIYILLNCLRGVWKSEVPSRLTNESFDFSGKRKPKGLAAYEMGGCLGAGGFGQVFSATRKRDKLPVSKELSLTLGQFPKKLTKTKNL